MGTTTNNSWPYPESTDYVADGATAIENLATAIDTTIADGYARGFLAKARLTANTSIQTGGTGLSVNVDCVLGRIYIMSVTTVVYYTTSNGYVGVTGTIDGTVRGEGYFGVTTSSTYNSGTIWTAQRSDLSGTVTFAATWTENPGQMYIAGSTNRDMTCIKVYDMGPA